MIALPSRHRSLTLLAAVVVTQVLLLAIQIKRERQVRLIRVWAVSLVSPIERAGRWTIDHLSGSWNSYVALRNTQRENQRLQAELDRLRLRNSELESRAAEADRLGGLLGFRQAHADVPMVAARVIGASPDSASRTIYINRGTRNGLRRDMAVITPEGIVGKIIEVYKDTAQVLLLTDKEGGAGALLASSRTQSPVGGLGEPTLVMKYISNDLDVPVGERVLTSGQDRIFPKDLPVGTVIESKPAYQFRLVRIKPAANLDRLEEVLVLLSTQELEPKKEPEPVPIRAAEKRLPKPPAPPE